MAADSAPIPAALSAAHPHDAQAGSRIVQQFTLFAGVGYVFFLAVTFTAILDTATVVAWWWTPTAVLLVYGTGISTFVLAVRKADMSTLRASASVTAAGFALTLALWPLAWDGTLLRTNTVWFHTLVGLPALTAAAAWRPVWPFVYMTATVIVSSTINHEVRVEGRDDSLVADTAWTLAFCLAPVAASVMGIRSARVLDDTREATIGAAMTTAAIEARAVERTRLDALTHDGVMATLLAAARQGRTPSVARQAQQTLREMRALGDDAATPDLVTADLALARIRHAVGDTNPGARPRVEVHDDAESTQFAIGVVDTMAAAAAEAMRNSMLHAGADARRWVEVTIAVDALTVVVGDDGVGFDPSAVPPHRLGVAVSIRGRLATLPGGRSSIVSSPGSGTVVTLTWNAS